MKTNEIEDVLGGQSHFAQNLGIKCSVNDKLIVY